ncbi:MAG: insulinase family protein [Deltaproteobacteria bacterium]|nr:insulinase family protein [Deltaproteobacteria bacterium]
MASSLLSDAMVVPTEPRPDDPLAVCIGRLANGLTVAVSPNPERPRVYCRVVVRAGAAQEPREATGLAHYLEHMLANKGTERLGTLDVEAERAGLARIRRLYEDLRVTTDAGERSQLVEAISAESAALAPFAIPNELKQLHGRIGSRAFNAFTSHDQTSYVVEVASERLAAWAAVESDRYRHPVFRSFQTEVETICEEKKRALDDPNRQTHRALMRALWAGHPYEEAVLGRSEHLESPSIEAMTAFFRRWYVPENMAVVLAGDVDPAAAIALVADAFGTLPSTPPGRTAPVIPELPAGEQRVTTTHRAQPELRIGWRTVPAGHPDELALELLDEVLHNQAVGVLDHLVHTQEVRSAGSFHRSRLDGGTFCLWGRPRAGQDLLSLERLLLAELERVRAGEVDASVLAGIVRNVEVDELASRESNKERANRIADAWLRGEDPSRSSRRLEELRHLGVDDVIRVANRWLGPDRVVLHRTEGEPSGRAPVTSPLPPLPPGGRGHSALYSAALGLAAPPPAPRTVVQGQDYSVSVAQGVRMVRAPNPHNDLVRITVRWEAGWERFPGVNVATRLARKGGLGGQTRSEVERRFFELATTVETRPGRWTMDLATAGPPETWADGLSLALQRMQSPVLAPPEAHKEIDDLMLRREQARATSRHHNSVMTAYATRGDQSTYLRRLQEPGLRALADSGPAALTAPLVAGALLVLATGPVDPDHLRRVLGGSRVAFAAPPPLDYVRPSRDRILLLHHPSQQAQVTVHSPQGGYRADDYGPRRLWAETMGGAAGLVFSEVREKRGMAYSAHAGLSNGWRAGDANQAWLRAGTEPGKAADVAALLLRILRTFPTDAARLGRVRESTLARRRSSRIGFLAVPATVEDWRTKGIEQDPLHEHLAALAETDDAAVRRYAEAVGSRPVTVTVVGDLTRVDRDGLAALADVTELTLDDLEVL